MQQNMEITRQPAQITISTGIGEFSVIPIASERGLAVTPKSTGTAVLMNSDLA
jgi:hypothetical protein